MKLINIETEDVSRIDYILRSAQRLADSYGLQPLKLIVVKDAATKAKLKPYILKPKRQSADAPIIVFAIWSAISEEKIDAYISHIAAAKKAPVAVLREDRKTIVKAINRQDGEGKQWAARQADIALLNLLASAHKVDVEARVEEADLAGFDKVLQLAGQGLQAVSAVSLHLDLPVQLPDFATDSKHEEHLFALI